MLAADRQQNPETTEQDRLETLERMLSEICERLTELVDEALDSESLESREARFQLEAFEERRKRALTSLDVRPRGALPVKIGKLERLMEALECSWDYFSGLAESAGITKDSSGWRMLAE